MADTNLYEDLKNNLQQFKDFLAAQTATIKPAFQALKQIVPQVTTLVDGLIELLNEVKTTIQNIDVGSIPGLDQVTTFTGQVNNLLTAMKTLLPDQASKIDQVLAATTVVEGLPSVDAVKADIISLIDSIVANLTDIKS